MKFLLFSLFFTYATAIRLQCEFSHGSWGIINGTYTCLVMSMDYTDNPIRVTAYEGVHLDGFTSLDVVGLSIRCFDYQYNLRTVPQGLLDFFPNLITMNFVACNGITLSGSELIEYQQLEGFGVTRSNIDRIPGNLFQPTPNLKVAFFASNQITTVGFNLLDQLKSLEEVRFESNICVNQNAFGDVEIQNLIQVLRKNCGDFVGENIMKVLKKQKNFWG